MRYVKKIKKVRISLLCCVLVAFLCSCGANIKPVAENDVTEVDTVVSTEQFLPVDTFGEDGIKLPYQSQENPYAMQTGRVDEGAVAKYIQARRAYRSSNFKHSEKLLNQLTENFEGLSGPWVMLGDIAYAQKGYELSIERYKNAIKVNSQNVNAYLRLARAYKDSGEFIAAQNTYAKLLGIWKDFPEAHLNLAILYDLYFNEELKAQQHMEAYMFLTQNKNSQVEEWLAEIRGRTGVSYGIKAGVPEELSSLSVAGEVAQ